jgi:hypothetical protein
MVELDHKHRAVVPAAADEPVFQGLDRDLASETSRHSLSDLVIQSAHADNGTADMTRPARRVPPQELRQIFNDGRYYERSVSGELLQVVESERPARAGAGQPAGTVSRMVWYFDDTLQRIALVHEYRLPDGTLGGSGKPDPKRLWVGDEILFC